MQIIRKKQRYVTSPLLNIAFFSIFSSMIQNILNKIKEFLGPYKNIAYISLAVWCVHIVLRILLLFRNNPYGFPFVSKPDWYIFHAITLDFLWICNSLIFFLIVGAIIQAIAKKFRSQLSSRTCSGISTTHPESSNKISKVLTVTYAVFHSILLIATILDQELMRFLGSHLSFGLVSTYKDTSSIRMFWDYSANDNSVPFIQFFMFALAIPAAYYLYKLFSKKFTSTKKISIFMVVFYIVSYLFINVIWTGNGRLTKLRPVVGSIYRDIFEVQKTTSLTDEEVAAYGKMYQELWQRLEGDSLWEFSSAKEGNGLPLYRIPKQELLQSEQLKQQRALKPNFILILMESERGLNVGCLNPNLKPSPTPFIDSIAAHSHLWERMHTSGLPTTGGVLTTHLGISDHSTLSAATDLVQAKLPSFASTLTDSGYTTHYMSAADPAWDNLGVWMNKWYTAQHYDRNREDDSTFFDHAISFIRDTLGTQEKPFLATLMTRSNHYPFNFAAGMPEEEKLKPLTERINYTMGYADRQVSRLIHAIENKDWYQNTYVIIMADHGFPLGENGSSTISGEAFSNATWIPFLIHGKGLEPVRDTATASQMDIAPTILELAGFAVPNIFMGHNLLRGHGEGYSLGAYTGVKAIGLDGYRLVSKYTTEEKWLFAESDTHQDNDLAKEHQDIVNKLQGKIDTLIKLADYSLEKGL